MHVSADGAGIIVSGSDGLGNAARSETAYDLPKITALLKTRIRQEARQAVARLRPMVEMIGVTYGRMPEVESAQGM